MTTKEIQGVGSQRTQCYICSAPLRRSPSKLRPRNYCSQTCRDADMAKPRKERADKGTRKAPRVSGPCATCGTPVERLLGDVRAHVYCSRQCATAAHRHGGRPPRATIGETRPVKDGYVEEYTAEGWRKQHRLVMERSLGRKLYPGENVHHRNGVRNDNRLENLEQWVTTQPKGQRPADLVEWAWVILDRYS